MAVLIAIIFILSAFKLAKAASNNAALAPLAILFAALGCGILGAM